MPSNSHRRRGKQRVQQNHSRATTPKSLNVSGEAEARNIPGFYYDQEKRRYFKIQKNHHAQLGASYTTSDVKQRLESAAQVQQEKDAIECNKTRIKRNRLIHSSLSGALISQEFAFAQSCASTKSEAVKHTLGQLHGAVGSNLEPQVFLDVDPDATLYNRGISQQSVTFKYDSQVNAIFFHAGAGTAQYLIAWLDHSHPFQYLDVPKQATCSELNRNLQFGTPTRYIDVFGNWERRCTRDERPSMSLGPGVFAMASEKALDGIIHHCFRETCIVRGRCQLPDSRRDRFRKQLYIKEDSLSHYDLNEVGIRNIIFQRNTESLWIASDNRLDLLGQPADETTWDLQPHLSHIEALESDVLCLEFLSENMLAVGMRNGKVKLYDVRQPRPQNTAAIVVHHPGSVTHLARTASSPQCLVANGIPDCMFMYDMRMVRPEQRRTSVASPVLRYDHHNSKYPALDLGFDASVELDLIAATQDDGIIRLFSMSTGKTMQNLSAEQDSQQKTHFKNIQIVKDDNAFCRIWAARGSKIYDFASIYH